MIDDMIEWITKETVTWNLEFDPHVAYAETIMSFLEFSLGDQDIERFADAEHLWIVQAYPRSAEAFYVTCGTTMIEALMRMYNTLHDKSEDYLECSSWPSSVMSRLVSNR